MKILQVIPVFSPSVLFGGSQRVAYLVSKGLAKKGHEVVIYTSDIRNLEERTDKSAEDIDGVTVVHTKSVSPSLLNKAGWIITPGIAKGLKTEIDGFDVIHVHEARSFQHIVIWQGSRRRGIPYVVQAHGNLSEHFGGLSRGIYDELFGKKILRDSSKVIAVNKIEASDYARFGVPERKVEIIPNPVDMDEFSNLATKGIFREKYKIKPESKVILFMGRIHPIKGVDILLHAFARIVKDGRVDGTLVVAGPDDGYLKECMNIAEMYNLNNVIFTGQLGDLERVHAYLDADVVAIPSKYEMFGMTALEAYACGKPVVASRTGGLKDLVIDNETGILVNVGSIDELSQALTRILCSSDFHSVATKTRNFAKQFSLEFIVNKLELLYRKLNSGSQRSQ